MNKFLLVFAFLTLLPSGIQAKPSPEANALTAEIPSSNSPIFDDKKLLEGYTQRYENLTEDVLLEMIKDDALTSYIIAASVRVLREKYISEMVAAEKIRVIKILWHRFTRNESPFVDIEIMYTLCFIDRYQYFESMIPALIQKLDHYNTTVNEMAFNALNDILEKGNNRPREARIVFNTLRKILFLSRNRLANVSEPGPRLSNKLQLLRWSIKILGNQELKKLPKEVINLL